MLSKATDVCLQIHASHMGLKIVVSVFRKLSWKINAYWFLSYKEAVFRLRKNAHLRFWIDVLWIPHFFWKRKTEPTQFDELFYDTLAFCLLYHSLGIWKKQALKSPWQIVHKRIVHLNHFLLEKLFLVSFKYLTSSNITCCSVNTWNILKSKLL